LREARPDLSQLEFNRLILAGEARFHNLYPLPPGTDMVRHLPKTARSCKLYPGFRPESPKAGHPPEHGVRDQLFPLVRYALAKGQQQEPLMPEQRCGYDDQCRLPLEPFAGVYSGFEAGDYQTAVPRQRQVTQTAIDPHRETASLANLFTVEVVEEGTDFAGYFSLVDAAAEQDLCNTVSSEGETLRIGYGRTRGLGLVEVIACRVDDPYLWEEDLPERLEAFNQKARDMQVEIPAAHTLFAITLLSDAILLDPFFRHQTALDGPTLAREIHEDLAGSELLAAFATTRQIFGWSTPRRLPLSPDLAVTAGSVFVFLSPRPQEELAAILAGAAVEQRGIGERCVEGFGQIVVCHPFHQEVSPV
jgi:CRISPR-associated protein Csx10